ncbi:hypothetical protein F383_34412 [Gossypium arboreum]|uniref:Uncharacterized protein n=1 Tax=Gossypium arboreum TaxID=29729 RepID=A0A0B0N652_GOSAR|nr:hypothetical protein F383_34412 [Gossypium arboreum]
MGLNTACDTGVSLAV